MGLALGAVLGVGSGARAQSAPAPAPAAPQPAASAPFTAGWSNGFVIQSADGDHRIVFGVVIQTDGRFTTDDPAPFTDTFTIRKVRPGIQGRVGKYFDFRLTPEFGNGTPGLQDAYLDVRFFPSFRVRVGKDKTPVGLEVLQGDPTLFFPERSLASSLLPNRDIGVQVQGDVAANRLSYSAGVFNGVVDGASSSTDVDTNAGKDLAARVLYQPFRTATTPARLLNSLGLHLGVSAGSQTGTLPSFRTSAGQMYFSYAGTTASGDRRRITPGVFYYYKAFGAFGEYVHVTQDVLKTAVPQTLTTTAWDVSGVINLTGEAASSGVVQPRRVFDPPSGRWGALQFVARYAELHADPEAFTGGLAAATASERARQATIGVNWYPVQYVKYYLNYERTTFAGGAAGRPAEHAILFRAQLAF